MRWSLRRGPSPSGEAASLPATDMTWEVLQARIGIRARRLAFRFRLSEEDAEDVAGEACLRLLRLFESPAADQVRDLDAYIARVVQNLCKAHIRNDRPVWTRLKAEVVETLRGHRSASGFALWKAGGLHLGGYDVWHGQTIRCTPACINLLQGGRTPRSLIPPGDLPAVLAHLFDWAGTPLPLNELTSAAFEILGLRERRPEVLETCIDEAPARKDVEADVLRAALVKDISRAFIALPREDAVAFLFHLPPEAAERLAMAVSMDGTTGGGVSALAERLRMCPSELEEALDTLPWTDLRIAAFLCLTGGTVRNVQQAVINRRQRALRHLRRALEDTEDGGHADGAR